MAGTPPARKETTMATIHGYKNTRYFVLANNPYGHITWFGSKRQRDQAVSALEEAAGKAGLSDPHFERVTKRIRTEAARFWLDRLQDAGVLRANGIDGPSDAPSHEWVAPEDVYKSSPHTGRARQTGPWMVVIQRTPEERFQALKGWDHVYTERAEALAALKRARKMFLSARLVQVEV